MASPVLWWFGRNEMSTRKLTKAEVDQMKADDLRAQKAQAALNRKKPGTKAKKKKATKKKATKKKVAKKASKTIETASTGIVLPEDFAPKRKPRRKTARVVPVPMPAPVPELPYPPAEKTPVPFPETTKDIIAEVDAKETDANKNMVEARRKILEIMDHKTNQLIDEERWDPIEDSSLDPINVFEKPSWYRRAKSWLSTLLLGK